MLQARGTVVLGLGLAVSGVALVVALGVNLASPAVAARGALAIYAANLVMAFFVQRPNLRRLVGVRATFDDRIWQARARRQRYVVVRDGGA